LITRFHLPTNGAETPVNQPLIKKLPKFEKPTIKDLQALTEGLISDEIAKLLLEQIEELCLIIIEQYASRQKI
jgi:hypothetical protein